MHGMHIIAEESKIQALNCCMEDGYALPDNCRNTPDNSSPLDRFSAEKEKKADFIQFRKRVYLKRKPGSKRRRQLLFDWDRGKVIPFPLTSVSSHGKELTDPRETRT